MKISQLDKNGRFEILDPELLAAIQGGTDNQASLSMANGGCVNETNCSESLNVGACANHGQC